MKLAASTEVLVRTFGIDGAIRIFARAGFDALDWSFFDLWREDDIWRQDDWRETLPISVRFVRNAVSALFKLMRPSRLPATRRSLTIMPWN